MIGDAGGVAKVGQDESGSIGQTGVGDEVDGEARAWVDAHHVGDVGEGETIDDGARGDIKGRN